MIIYKCDLCKKQVEKIETVILYHKSIDFCENCKVKATKMKRAMQKSRKYYNEKLEEELQEAENNILGRY